jgi:hypothetical protein
VDDAVIGAVRSAIIITTPYLARYAQEAVFREDHRRVDNRTQVRGVMGLAMAAPVSVNWCGYWQRAAN